MACTVQFLLLLNKNKRNLSQITQIVPISLLFCPVGYRIRTSVFLGQPHIVSTRKNSLRSLELIYSRKNVDFVFVFLYATSSFLYGNFLKIVSPNVLGLHVPVSAKADTTNFKDQSNCSRGLHGIGLAC